ncbi:DUF5694 domain-containing protein [Sediminibacterium sp.]|uniref:DUF5694 domain-containing protein n=1 Tax=Sediminibacterium sp. TaxID=1917865 RepID=UPI0025CEDB87|nr:DUF5694 domain-containing protein [Sediminibacterium sp.]MBW0179315.1 hypothetical protein [Sediminibacterium sp.]
MKYIYVFIILFSIASLSSAQTILVKKTEVLLLGTFHFANPGLDVAKFEDVNILSDKRQKEVEALIAKLKTFKPDKIFIEVPVAGQKRYDSLLNAYKNGTHILSKSESQQIGFRLAKECGLSTLYCSDYTNVSFPMDSITRIMAANQQMGMLKYLQETIQKEQTDFNEQLKTKTITEILIDQNTEAVYKKLAGLYYFFLKAGDKSNHVGSFLASEQWRRNTYIYENILKELDGKEQRILVLYGTTHVAMLKEMMKYNDQFDIIPVSKIL